MCILWFTKNTKGCTKAFLSHVPKLKCSSYESRKVLRMALRAVYLFYKKVRPQTPLKGEGCVTVFKLALSMESAGTAVELKLWMSLLRVLQLF